MTRELLVDDVWRVVFEYRPCWKLRPEIPESKLNWKFLSENPRATDMLNSNPEKINIKNFVFNPHALTDIPLRVNNFRFKQIMEMKPNIIRLWQCRHAFFIKNVFNDRGNLWIKLLMQNPNLKHKYYNLYYPVVIDFENIDKCIDNTFRSFFLISGPITRIPPASNPYEIDNMKPDIYDIDWKSLQFNSRSLDILLQYPQKIDWNIMSRNPDIFVASELDDIFFISVALRDVRDDRCCRLVNSWRWRYPTPGCITHQ